MDERRGAERRSQRTPAPQGLYSPDFEHDACGVGAVCDLKGRKSHKIIKDALEILRNLEHRGASGCDALTGDGAGILIQMPDQFLRERAQDEGFRLPEEGGYGVGLVFLPRKPLEREWCVQRFEEAIRAEGQEVLGWRDLPTDNGVIGEVAREGEPVVRQIFIGRGRDVATPECFERKL